jgi:hypothetical protein
MVTLIRKLLGNDTSAGRRSPSSSNRGAGCRLGLEALCGLSPARRTWSARPAVETLEERRVPSASGVISSITDARGQTMVFEVASNGQVYEFNKSVSSSWFPFVGYDPTGFRQVSAGLDASGRGICYALHNGDNHVWKMDNYSTVGFTAEGHDLGWDATQISGTRNNECFVIHAHTGSDWVGIYNGYSSSWSAWNGPWGGLMQISTGVDRYGHDEVYMLNGSQNVYRLDNGTYWVLPMTAKQISAGAGRNSTDNDLFYIQASDSMIYHYDGSSTTRISWTYASQIATGLDQYGNEIVYDVDLYYHDLWRWNLSGGGQELGGGINQISAAGNDMVFAVAPGDNKVWDYDRDSIWGSSGWNFLNGWAANPFSSPFSG